jgi:hypothetical protein
MPVFKGKIKICILGGKNEEILVSNAVAGLSPGIQRAGFRCRCKV